MRGLQAQRLRCLAHLFECSAGRLIMGGGTPASNVSKAALNALTRILTGKLSLSRMGATDMSDPGGRPYGYLLNFTLLEPVMNFRY